MRLTGRLTRLDTNAGAAWERLKAKAIADDVEIALSDRSIEAPWPFVLNVVREYGNKTQQAALNFRFKPTASSADRLSQFMDELKSTRLARSGPAANSTLVDIEASLRQLGFTRRSLKPFQVRDLRQLLLLKHGANFSVPGAGKTTVTFALHLLIAASETTLLVVGPKSSFAAWRAVAGECLDGDLAESEQFLVLDGDRHKNGQLLASGARRFLITYDLAVRQADVIASFLARRPVHLVLDEAHRMKAGLGSQRGAFLLNVATLPVRRDILTGTPMPQGASDLAAQLAFLWPGQGLDLQITRGAAPREVSKSLYVRTTKSELGIPPARRHYIQVGMASGHLALYSVVRNEALRQLTLVAGAKDVSQIDFLSARKSVMRLLQLSTNPLLALQGIAKDTVGFNSGIASQVLAEGPSEKMRAVEAHVRSLADGGKKVLIWTIFTDTLLELERMLADLNPVTLFGGVPSGLDSDLTTREGRIRRFHEDPQCRVVIANPAAAGEGISLHKVCHDAIYLDRSYVSTHYLQSIDRIHRLGLPEGTETNIYIYQTKAPAGLGSIDFSVSRRLATKIRSMQQLLDDPDLHKIALDEEEADDPIDFSMDLQDLVDLVEELEGTARSFNETEEL